MVLYVYGICCRCLRFIEYIDVLYIPVLSSFPLYRKEYSFGKAGPRTFSSGTWRTRGRLGNTCSGVLAHSSCRGLRIRPTADFARRKRTPPVIFCNCWVFLVWASVFCERGPSQGRGGLGGSGICTCGREKGSKSSGFLAKSSTGVWEVSGSFRFIF